MRDDLGFDIEKPRDDIMAMVDTCGDETDCEGSCAELCKFVHTDHSYNPYIVGHYLGIIIKNYFNNDGWNREGKLQYSPSSDEPVECTASCRVFQDTSGYTPVPDPRKYPWLSTDTSKYDCTGNCTRWQPLQEGEDRGSLLQQEFVAPHIGKHAKMFLRNVTYTLEDPEYDLYPASLQVIEEVKDTSSNETKKQMIKFMDDKVRVRRDIQMAVRAQYAETGLLSFQEYVLFLIGISTAEIDGVVQAWAEKVKFDKVRPTTVIKHWDDDDLYTFGGVREHDGPVDIKARDFEAFIRVMPHGEYPSGSSCLCSIYKEFTDKFLNDRFNSSITDFDAIDVDGVTFADMQEYSDLCGISRVWGGLHYPEAIPAGEATCAGIGTLAVEWVDTVRNGAFDNEWYFGTPRPDNSHCT